MTEYMICYDLAAPLQVQEVQISYWLNFLSTILPAYYSTSHNSISDLKFEIILVGLREDQRRLSDAKETEEDILEWLTTWNHLPINSKLSVVSALTSTKSVKQLLSFVEGNCKQIMDQHSIAPAPHQKLLQAIQKRKGEVLASWEDLYNEFGKDYEEDKSIFLEILKYLQAVGRIVLFSNGMVCTDPLYGLQIASAFTSPDTAQTQLSMKPTDNVSILTEKDIAILLSANSERFQVAHAIYFLDSDLFIIRLSKDLELMQHLKICYKLSASGAYLFPSLSLPASMLQPVLAMTEH